MRTKSSNLDIHKRIKNTGSDNSENKYKDFKNYLILIKRLFQAIIITMHSGFYKICYEGNNKYQSEN